MNPSVASVTTAYNAIDRLPPHLDALLSQSRALQEIIVVDNGSADGTAEMVSWKYPQVTLLRLSRNVGAAGGFAAGLRYAALERGHDWVWNFDDDSLPGTSALELLLLGAGELAKECDLGMLAPLPIHAMTGTIYPPLLWREGFVKPDASTLELPFWFADLVVASGCMVRREVVQAVGLPREDFFMDFFDFEYCLRIRSRGYKIGVVRDCKFSHEIGNVRTFRFGRYIRTWTEHSPWREYYMIRNVVYSLRWLYPSLRASRFGLVFAFRHAVGILFFGAEKLSCLRWMLHGIADGWQGKLGVRVLPDSSLR